MKSPKISIVIPSYNKVNFINKTLRSIFEQNYPNLEVIIQDGGSTDGTLEIIKKYVKKYPKMIKWESKNDKGQLDAVNMGLKKATGEILTFINADDEYENNSFNLIADAYQKNQKALWFAGYGKIINEDNQEIAKFWSLCKKTLLNLNFYPLLILTANYFMQPSVFITKKAFKKYGPFTGVGRYIFEYEMWLKIGKISMPKIIPDYLSSFRIGKSNMSSVYYKNLFEMDIKVTKKYSNNIIVFLHKINNYLRMLTIKFINR